MSAADHLEAVRAAVADRGAAYGPPGAFLSLLAKRWSLVLGVNVTPHQAGQMLIDLKQARLTQCPGHPDSIVDIGGYALMMAGLPRCAAEDRCQGSGIRDQASEDRPYVAPVCWPNGDCLLCDQPPSKSCRNDPSPGGLTVCPNLPRKPW